MISTVQSLKRGKRNVRSYCGECGRVSMVQKNYRTGPMAILRRILYCTSRGCNHIIDIDGNIQQRSTYSTA